MKHWEELQNRLNRRAEINKTEKIEISQLGKRVAQMLGVAYGGLHHISENVLFHKRTKWDNDNDILLTLGGGDLATYDFNRLTLLVILAHDYCVRFSVNGAAPNYIKLGFSKRDSREGSIYYKHPTIEKAIEDPESKWRPDKEEQLSLGVE